MEELLVLFGFVAGILAVSAFFRVRGHARQLEELQRELASTTERLRALERTLARTRYTAASAALPQAVEAPPVAATPPVAVDVPPVTTAQDEAVEAPPVIAPVGAVAAVCAISAPSPKSRFAFSHRMSTIV